MRGHRDLQIACLAAVAGALVAALAPWAHLRLLGGLPLTLFLPGYAIVAAAFGSRELAAPKRIMLSVAISLMVLALGAFVLNIFPFGLETASWAVLLPLVVIAACRGAALRRERPKRPRAGRPALPRPATGSLVLFALAAAIALGALALAERPLPAENAKGFTALWMLPTDKSEDAVAIGVDSNQHDARSYRLRVSLGKDQSKTYRVELDPGEERVYEVDVPPKPVGRTHVVASLYKEGEPERLYRRVTSWLPRQMTFP
jgi:uncharacterized membrane protein